MQPKRGPAWPRICCDRAQRPFGPEPLPRLADHHAPLAAPGHPREAPVPAGEGWGSMWGERRAHSTAPRQRAAGTSASPSLLGSAGRAVSCAPWGRRGLQRQGRAGACCERLGMQEPSRVPGLGGPSRDLPWGL